MNTEKRKKRIPKKRRIKVMHVIFGLRAGGAERMLFNLLKNANTERFDISVVCVSEGGPFKKEIENLGFPVTIIGKKSKLGLSTLWRMYKHIKQVQPDICHTHLFAGDTWGRIAAFVAKVPVVISTEHNTNVNEGKVKSVIRRILSWKTDKVVAISKAIKDFSVKYDGINPDKMPIIYSGLDFSVFPKTIEFTFNKTNPVIAIVGRLEEQKGHTFFIEALPEILKQYPEMKVQFIGDGSLKTAFQEQAQDLGVLQNIEFLGNRKDVYACMQKADIICMPSVFEGLGLVAQEALYLKKPIIASRVGGLQEVLKEQETGVLVNPKSVQEIVEAVSFVMENTDQIKQMAQAGHVDMKKRFDVKDLANQYEELYEQELHHNFTTKHKVEDAVLALTYLCNSRCVMCNIWKITDKPTMSLEDYKKLPKSLKYINISGGEPFLRPDIIEIVKTIKEQNPKAGLVISSNGFATNLIVKKVKEILEIDPEIGVALSLDGMAEKHEEVRGIKDGYHKLLETLHQLRDAGVKHLRIAFTAADYNIHELNTVYQLSRKENVDFTMAAVHNSTNYFGTEDNKIELDNQFKKEFTQYIRSELKRFHPKKWVRAYFAWGLLQHVLYGGRVLPDYSGKKHIFIDPDGKVFPCDVSSDVMGNMKEEKSFDALMQKKEAFEAIQFNRRHNDHWMICTSRMSIRSHPLQVIFWILKAKLFGVRV